MTTKLIIRQWFKVAFSSFSVLIWSCLLAYGAAQADSSLPDGPRLTRSATAVIERYHKGLGGLTEAEQTFAAQALRSRPETIGYFQSTLFPIRCHYATAETETMAEEVLAIMENSWEVQVLAMGFRAPLPDYGEGGSDDLDVYILELPQGIGGYAAFSSYYEETPEADASCFIAVASSLGPRMVRGSATHEFHHCCQAAADYWEHITFKENTATWVMDYVYDDENYYVTFLKAFQQNPDWPVHRFSSTNTYQYGGCMVPHFFNEYYSGANATFLVQWWEGCVQNELSNEPDYFDAVKELISDFSGGMDTFNDAMTEFALWRYACGPRDDGKHFHDGGVWGNAALVSIDTEVDLTNLPYLGGPQKPPYDYGYSYFSLINPPADSWLALEFDGDPEVDWGLEVILVDENPNAHHATRVEVTDAHAFHTLGPQQLASHDRIIVAVVNLSNPGFDPDIEQGTQKSYTLAISKAPGTSALTIRSNRPVLGSGDELTLQLSLEYEGVSADAQLYIAMEVFGEFWFLSADPSYPNFTPEIAGFTLPLEPGLWFDIPLFTLAMPQLPEAYYLQWHAALLNQGELLNYCKTRTNLVPERR